MAPVQPLLHVTGSRQTGKTHRIRSFVGPRASLLRMDLDPIRAAGLRASLEALCEVGREPGALVVDDLHLLPDWPEQVAAVAREGIHLVLAGQHQPPDGATRVDLRPRSFRAFLEARLPSRRLPPAADARALLGEPVDVRDHLWSTHRAPRWDGAAPLHDFARRGGYPGALFSAEPAETLLTQVLERALGIDAPARAPVEQPALLRRLLFELARRTGTEVSQGELARDLGAAQPVVGRYLDHLEGVGLVREFRRHPYAAEARVPSKMTLVDPGLRYALLREDADPTDRPMAETLLQPSLHGHDLTVRFWRDYEKPGDRRSPIESVSFVLVAEDRTLPIQVSAGPEVAAADERALRSCIARLGAPLGLLVTRDSFAAPPRDRVVRVPLVDLLLALG